MNRELRRVRRAFRWHSAVTTYPKAMHHYRELRLCERSVRLADIHEDEPAYRWFRRLQSEAAYELELYVEMVNT